MNRGQLLVVALVAAVALSGCSWVEQEEPTPDSDNSSDSDNMIPVFRIDGHANALANTSYALDIQAKAVKEDERANRTISVRSNLSSKRFLLHNEIRNRSLTRYVNGTTVYSKVVRNGTTNYTAQSLSDLPVNFSLIHRKAVQRERLTTLYRIGDFEKAGNVTEGGRQYTEFTLVNYSNPSNATVAESSGQVRIRDDDVIERGYIDLSGGQNGSAFRFVIDYRTTRTENVSVEPPEWLADAEAASSRAESAGNETTATDTAAP